MRKLSLLFYVTIFCFSPLFSQSTQDSIVDRRQLPNWGSEELVQALALANSGKAPEARSFFVLATEDFEASQIWEGYIFATRSIVYTYQGSPDYENGIKTGLEAIQKITKNAPELLKLCDDHYHGMSVLYGLGEEYEKSEEMADKQLALLKDHYPLDSNWRFGRAYLNKGVSLNNISNDPYDPLRYYIKSINVLEGLKDLSEKDQYYIYATLSNVYSNIASIYSGIGNYDKAAEYSTQAIENILQRESELSAIHLIWFHTIAKLYQELNEFELSNVHTNKLIDIANEIQIEDEWLFNDFLIPAYLRLGENTYNLDKPEQSLPYYQKCLSLCEKYQLSHPAQPNALVGISKAYMAQKEYDLAFDYSQQADSLFTVFQYSDVFRRNRYILTQGKINLLLVLAHIYNAKGDLTQTKETYRAIIEADPNDPYLKINTLIEFAQLFDIEHQPDSALYYSRKAFIASYNKFDSTSVNNLPEPTDIIPHKIAYEALDQWAEYWQRLAYSDKDQQTKYSSLEQTLRVVQLIDQYHDINLKKINLLRGSKSKPVLESVIKPYRRGLSIANDLYEMNNDKSYLNESFFFVQKMKAQQLWMALLNSKASEYSTLPKDLLLKERDLLAEIQFFEKKALEARIAEDTVDLALYENKYLYEKRFSYNNLLRQMEVEYPDYYTSKYNFIPETAERLQQLLAPGELLIEYALADSSLYIFTLAHDTPLQRTKVTWNKYTNRRIDSLSLLLQNTALTRPSSKNKYIQLSHELYKQFLLEIAPQLADKERLIIIGDSKTNYIPFEVLLPSYASKPLKELDYLIRKHDISYHYSSTLFAQSRKQFPLVDSKNIFAFAPIFDYEQSKTSNAYKIKSFTPLRATDEEGRLVPLPESEREVKTILKLFANKSKNSSQLSLRAEALESTLKLNLQKPYRFIHIASHSFANLNHPEFSGIACYDSLKQDSSEAIEDHILYAGEIYNLKIQADLVTLSSCESGLGKLEKTEGLLGLNRAFIYAGTPNVIFSLWKVYDKVSADLMVDFYKNTLINKNYAQSLRQAKLSLLNNEATASPHYWSPYLLIGR